MQCPYCGHIETKKEKVFRFIAGVPGGFDCHNCNSRITPFDDIVVKK